MGFLYMVGFIIFLLASIVVGAFTILTTILEAATSKEVKRKKFLQLLIQDLEEQGNTSEFKAVIAAYKKELKSLGGEAIERTIQEVREDREEKSEHKAVVHKVNSKPIIDWNNWYSENSISLLLYIGAALIILTASILVGFSWQSLTGIVKALLLTATAVGFLGSGILFSRNTLVKNAGTTFSALGTILISFVGVGWYVFVLRDMGIMFGWVGLVTALVTLLTSIALSYLLGGVVYPYLTGLAMIGSVLSIIQTSNPPFEWYIFATQLLAFLFLGMKKIYVGTEKRDFQYARAAEQFAQVLMPVSVFIGVFLAIKTDSLFTIKPSISIMVAAAYYAVAYLVYGVSTELYLSQIILPIGVSMLMFSYKYPADSSLLVASISYCFWSVVGFLIHPQDEDKRSWMTFIGMGGACLVATIAWIFFSGMSFVVPLTMFIAAAASFMLYMVLQQELILIPLAITLGSGLEHGISSYGGEQMVFWYGSFAIVSFLWYITGKIFFSKLTNHRQVSNFIAAAFYFYGIFMISAHPTTSLILSGGAIGFALVLLYFREKLAISILTAAMVWFAWNVLGLYQVGFNLYIIVYALIGYVLYSISFYDSKNPQWAFHAYTVLLVAPLMLPLLRGVEYFQGSAVWNSVAAESLAVAIISFVAFSQKNKDLLYKLSVPAMIIVSWFLMLSDMWRLSVHSCIWGAYLLVLGLLKRHDHQDQEAETLDFFGMMVLFVPGLYHAFSGGTVSDALIVAVSGLVMIGYGITRSRKLFMQGGAVALFLAILSQTYSYILGLEQWMITGILGLIFFAGAITLLIRKQKK